MFSKEQISSYKEKAQRGLKAVAGSKWTPRLLMMGMLAAGSTMPALAADSGKVYSPLQANVTGCPTWDDWFPYPHTDLEIVNTDPDKGKSLMKGRVTTVTDLETQREIPVDYHPAGKPDFSWLTNIHVGFVDITGGDPMILEQGKYYLVTRREWDKQAPIDSQPPLSAALFRACTFEK